MLAHLPLALDDRIRTALSIGLGSGATHASLLGYPFFSSVDCVEINAGVVRGAELFEYASARSDPRSRIVVDDALHFLRVHSGRYDLIISDGKQSDDFSGNAKLLSQEFYELVLSRLREDGLFAQWTHLGLVPEAFSAVLRTAVTAFPELEVFFEPPGSVILIGSRKPLTGRPHLTDSAIEDLPARADFELIHIAGPSALRARWVASRTELKSILGNGPLNTWDLPFVEFAPYKSVAGNEEQRMLANARLLNHAHNSASDVAHQLAPPDAPATRVMTTLRMALLRGWNHDRDSGHRLLVRLRREYPDEPTAAHWERVLALWARSPES